MTETDIVKQIIARFPTFGGGQKIAGNPIAEWTAEKPPMFALGVDVAEVVHEVLKLANVSAFKWTA